MLYYYFDCVTRRTTLSKTVQLHGGVSSGRLSSSPHEWPSICDVHICMQHTIRVFLCGEMMPREEKLSWYDIHSAVIKERTLEVQRLAANLRDGHERLQQALRERELDRELERERQVGKCLPPPVSNEPFPRTFTDVIGN